MQLVGEWSAASRTLGNTSGDVGGEEIYVLG